jgi:hypothetical protein
MFDYLNQEEHFEASLIELIQYSIIIICVYRTPNSNTVETGYIAARYIAESDIKRALSCLPNISSTIVFLKS